MNGEEDSPKKATPYCRQPPLPVAWLPKEWTTSAFLQGSVLRTPPPRKSFPPFAGTGYSGYRMGNTMVETWTGYGSTLPKVFAELCGKKASIPVVTAGKIRMPDLADEIVHKSGPTSSAWHAPSGRSRPGLSKPGTDGDDGIVKCAACGWCSEINERYETVLCIQWPKGVINAPDPSSSRRPVEWPALQAVDVNEYIDLIGQGRF